jgi:hypothetical protein
VEDSSAAGSIIHLNRVLVKTRDKNTRMRKASTTHSGKATGKPGTNQSHNTISKTSKNHKNLPISTLIETNPANPDTPTQ